MSDPDEELRSACFAELRRLCTSYPQDIPYRRVLESGFPFHGKRIPFLTPYKGIYRARAQRGKAALSVNTSTRSPYRDRATADGWIYSYRAGSIDQPDNGALRAAYVSRAPIVYFRATAPGYYQPLFPWFIDADDPVEREVHITPGKDNVDGLASHAAQIDDPLERTYRFRETRIRVHQASFRRLVLPPYGGRCAICSLHEERLLDAAHIIGDTENRGEPVIVNGVSLCTIHHRAFDNDLVGISPDYEVRVSRRLLEEEDGPMLDLLKGFHRQELHVPERRSHQPDRARLAERFERFRAAA